MKARHDVYKLTDQEMGVLVDRYFPIRIEGRPSYRRYQRWAIMTILKHIRARIKYICLDAPVGSGKSVINYTVGMVASTMNYLTTQKQLQDQIHDEEWPSCRALKGRNAYACNLVMDDDVDCTYGGPKHTTCNNSDATINIEEDVYTEALIKDVMRIRREYANDLVELKRHDVFSKDTPVRDQIATLCDKDNYTEADLNEELGIEGYSEHAQECKGEHPMFKVGCVLAAVECPVKAARNIVRLSRVRVLNPDLYMRIKKYMFRRSTTMAIDECHGMEDVIGRIYRTSIPIDAVWETVGIDLRFVREVSDSVEFRKRFASEWNDSIGPALVASQLANKMAHLILITDAGTLVNKLNTGSARKWEYSILMRYHGDLTQMAHDRTPINLIDMFCTAIENGDAIRHGVMSGFVDSIRTEYKRLCKKEDCGDEFGIRGFLRRPAFSGTNVFKRLCHINGMLKESLGSLSGMVSTDGKDGKPVFVYEIGKKIALHELANSHIGKGLERIGYGNMAPEDIVTFVPIDTGSILRRDLYSNSNHILFSSGTWNMPSSMMESLGINPEEAKFVEVPTLFERKNRWVYILKDNRYTNFSEKDEGGWFVYKTPAGQKKFVGELMHTLIKARQFVASDRGCGGQCNMLVHCNSYEIIKMIYEHVGQSDDMLFQLSSSMKDGLVATLKNNHDAGLTLFSPSITEGVDFKNGAARAQIILKAPIPYMMDQYVKSRRVGNDECGIKKDPLFIDRMVMTTVLQTYGRVVRSENDWGYTFIIDQALSEKIYGYYRSKSSSQIVKELKMTYLFDGICDTVDRKFIWPL